MSESIELWLENAEKTLLAGASLARSRYRSPLTILCSGDLGSGKTTFIQGLASGLGVRGPVTSPTFALEQRYRTAQGQSFLHLDLYRIPPSDVFALLHASDGHGGIRCIEWGDRLPADSIDEPTITIDLAEDGLGRRAAVTFGDATLPTPAMVEGWRKLVHLPLHIALHCDAVAAFAVLLADALLKRATVVRQELLRLSGLVHDLFRFIDFRDGAAPEDTCTTAEDEKVWGEWKQRWTGLHHEEACAQFLSREGYPALAEIVRVHGLTLPPPKRRTTEQKLLYYADKRVSRDRVVSLEERFTDFRQRYSNGNETLEGRQWYEEARGIELELFPEGAP